MKNNKNKILVLIDVKKNIESTLKSTIALANIIKGEITLFYVKKPTEVVNVDNQLSAIRGINEDYTLVESEIKNAIESISKKHNITINYNFSYGNVKNEITRHIEEIKPDTIVLGKRKAKAVNFIGDKITNHIINTFKGLVMIAPKNNVLETSKELTIGVLNANNENKNVLYPSILQEHTTQKIKSFTFIKNSNGSIEPEPLVNSDGTPLVLNQNENAIKNLSNYIVQNNINLFCVNREQTSKKEKTVLAKKDIKNLIDKIEVPLLFADSRN
ncbi:universal stress protein [Lacinutrix sp. 5H-3-7-4]|uniref:universal stress protein n=1 Tax=Lacinutrix sp. (strain 5H-3-7-4) TaxID=983544 RepID=UPI00020A3513|nr:universal stress protein [Lacinutrix sp. 5H-3-7-4]AEH00740.1 hypothetical protein Lacal_0892 [Lacinutrix sp. 5H-3-7-4]